MLWFFFHTRVNGTLTIDPEGSEFHDLDAAKKEAIAALREMIADRLRGGGLLIVPQIEVADQAGQTLAIVTLRDAMDLPR
ncbi:hypothetical protein JMJ56_31750 [Belnapia sp. T18]|uniref:DUF6894 domain-containing protein n=1 Tax=Belnapia arida TaxID=2804533 RepID=A0ABS1UGY2_9PROT|nr:hypothetical protein [Belnapia arida]MBL6082541.1 hypothetical protein [Belnapia arida]